MAPESNEYREQRIENMQKLQEMSYAPYGAAFERSAPLGTIREEFEEGKAVKVAGRLMTIRKMGKTMFADLRDGSGRFQLFVNRGVLGDHPFAAFKLLDLGDQIGVEGALFTTRTGEPSIRVKQWTLLSKSLLPLPEKFHGLRDTDQRYRQRYIDLMANPEVRDLFNKRIAAVREIRHYLEDRGFQEVETPIMQSQAGGAAAKPFVTHYEALHTDMYLRIAPELYLKRLLVGGFDKVFELNRNFRNEGIDRTHNPEFTMLEIYEAFGSVTSMKVLIEGMIRHVASEVFGTLNVGEGDSMLDLASPWRTATYAELIKERMGDDWYDLDLAGMVSRAEDAGLSVDPAWDSLLVTHEVYEKLIEKSLIQPTFVTRLPAPLIPLARACEDDSTVVDVFELVINGQEVAPAYTEMNDPLEQRRRLENQAGEDAEKIDEEFLAALEYGMPPAGGMGVGVDRLVMILSGQESIRDVILFPQLKNQQP